MAAVWVKRSTKFTRSFFFSQQIETFRQTPQSEELNFFNFEDRLLEVAF